MIARVGRVAGIGQALPIHLRLEQDINDDPRPHEPVDEAPSHKQTPVGEKLVRLPFETPLTEGGQVREILTAMTHAARAKLGKEKP